VEAWQICSISLPKVNPKLDFLPIPDDKRIPPIFEAIIFQYPKSSLRQRKHLLSQFIPLAKVTDALATWQFGCRNSAGSFNAR